MAWVFLAGPRVFKMKKPVRYPFLDFSTLAARRHVVAEEIRLNRRLAPTVYRGATPLTREAGGSLAFAGPGPAVEWLVEMNRLPEDRMLDRLLECGVAGADATSKVGAVLVGFYAALPRQTLRGEDYVRRFEEEHERTAEILCDPHVAFDGTRVASVLHAFERSLAEGRPLLAARADGGRIVEGHGDLRPEHVCLLDPPVIIDCLEFDRRMRLVDPFDEAVFLGLESARLGADRVLPDLLAILEAGLGERPPPPVLRFYWQYRALLRARLALLHLAEARVRTPGKWRPQAWRYVELAEKADRVCRHR
jgi:aminoglycoside phosphotransferase family enzyme